MPAVTWLLAKSPMIDRSKMITQIKRDALVFQVADWVWGRHLTPNKICFVEKLLKLKARWKQLR